MSVITPLIRVAIELHPRAFFYLYRHLFRFTSDRDNELITFQRRPWNWKIVPWSIVVIFITGVAWVGCSIFLCCGYLLGLRWTSGLSIFRVLIFFGVGVVSMTEVLGVMLLVFHPELETGFRQLFVLEKEST